MPAMALSDVQTCDACGAVVCASCKPDAISVCEDNQAVHCSSCARSCALCTAQALLDQDADAAMEEDAWAAR